MIKVVTFLVWSFFTAPMFVDASVQQLDPIMEVIGTTVRLTEVPPNGKEKEKWEKDMRRSPARKPTPTISILGHILYIYPYEGAAGAMTLSLLDEEENCVYEVCVPVGDQVQTVALPQELCGEYEIEVTMGENNAGYSGTLMIEE